MIFILNEAREGNVPRVLEWLAHDRAPYKVLNSDQPFEALDIHLSNKETGYAMSFGEMHVDLDSIQAWWYRRGDFVLAHEVEPESMQFLEQHYIPEWESLSRFLVKKLNSVPGMGNPSKSNLDKLSMLDAARKAGLRITETFVISQKSRLLELLDTFPRLITKGIGDSIDLVDDRVHWGAATEVIDKDTVMGMPDHFFPSLVQPYVEKQLEIRVFYVFGKMWSMAIFSQNDPQTRLDYRNYNHERPNRNVPFQLPEPIEAKIHVLMKSLELNTGSLDFILTPENEFVFLEVNPDGQYGWLSENCNYYLDKEIAEALVEVAGLSSKS